MCVYLFDRASSCCFLLLTTFFLSFSKATNCRKSQRHAVGGGRDLLWSKVLFHVNKTNEIQWEGIWERCFQYISKVTSSSLRKVIFNSMISQSNERRQRCESKDEGALSIHALVTLHVCVDVKRRVFVTVPTLFNHFRCSFLPLPPVLLMPPCGNEKCINEYGWDSDSALTDDRMNKLIIKGLITSQQMQLHTHQQGEGRTSHFVLFIHLSS